MTQHDHPDFIAHLAGLYRDCVRLTQSADSIAAGTQRRIESILRNRFLRRVEIGEELLAVQAARADEFENWFQAHEARLGFTLRTARRCKADARLFLEHGLETALSILAGSRERPSPFLSIRLPMSPDQVPAADIPAWLDRLRPAAEAFHQLEQRAAS